MKSTVAIVTGASQGIGRSTAIRLARDFKPLFLPPETARHSMRLPKLLGRREPSR